jgi:hypothetical protein
MRRVTTPNTPGYSKNHKKPLNLFCGKNEELLIIKTDGTYN